MLALMKCVLCDKDDADISMMYAFRKQIAHLFGVHVVQRVIQDKYTWLSPRVFKKKPALRRDNVYSTLTNSTLSLE